MKSTQTTLLILFFAVSTALLSTEVIAQCNVNILNTLSDTLTIPCGASVQLERDTNGLQPIFETFNTGQAGPFWQTTSNASFSNPCGPGSDGSTYLWMGNGSLSPRNLTALPLDLSCGAEVCFQLRYSVQGAGGFGGSPCEGPDLPAEGVTFEYSIGGGGPWTQIDYYTPNISGSLNSLAPGIGDYTGWATYCYVLPPAASVPNVVLRWQQYAATAAGNDHWGIDSVVVSSLCGGSSNLWSTGDTGRFITTPSLQTPTQYWVMRIVQPQGGGVADTCFDTLLVNPTSLMPDLMASPILCHGDSTAIQANVTGGTGQQQFSWSTGATGSTLADVPVGTYTVTVTDSSGCVAIDTIVLDQPDSLYAWYSIDLPTCDSTTDGGVSIVGLGGTPYGGVGSPYNFIWQGVNLLPDDTNRVLNLDTGIYTYVITDALGCRFEDTINILQGGAHPLISLADTIILCQGSTVVLDAGNDGETFAWSTGDTNQTVTVNAVGSYFVTVSSMEGCISNDSTYVVLDPCLGVGELDSEQFIVFPNPTSNILRIQWDDHNEDLVKLMLYANNGRLVRQMSITSERSMELDIANLPQGIYLLELQSQTGSSYFRKVVKF